VCAQPLSDDGVLQHVSSVQRLLLLLLVVVVERRAGRRAIERK